jgi:hypothetical protein
MDTPKKPKTKRISKGAQQKEKASSRKQSKGSTKEPTTNEQQAEVPVNKIQQNEINLLFAQALNRYKQELLQEKKDKFKEINHLALIAEEYLSCFALIGYSLQNERVTIFNMPSSKDEAALVDLLRSTFIDIANNRP